MAHGIEKLTQTQQVRMEHAVALTAAQINTAVELVRQNLAMDQRQNSPEVLSAVIQALATNYAATVAAASAK